MPKTSSAKKALRGSLRKRKFNLKRINAMKTSLKEAKKSKGGKKEDISKLISSAYKSIDKAAKRGVIKKGTADRKKSRLVKFLNKKQ